MRAETRIELRTRVADERILLEGALRDDLGNDLAGREVLLQASPEGSSESIRRRLATAPDGRFRVGLPSTFRIYEVRVGFEGDHLHQRVEVARTLDLTRADVRLEVRLPGGSELNLDEPFHPVEVSAHSDAGGSGLQVTVLDELSRILAEGRTDATGHVRFTVRSDRIGPPGAGRLKVEVRRDATRAEALTEVPVVRFYPTRLSLSADPAEARPASPISFRGHLRSSAGPLVRRAIGLYEGEQHLTTILTDDTGAFTAALTLPGSDRTALIVARFASDAPGREGSESAPAEVKIQRAAANQWPWLLLPLLACALFLLLTRGQRRVGTDASNERKRPRVPIETGRRGRRADRNTLSGRIVDAGDDQPLHPARVHLEFGERNEQSLATDESGRFRVEELPEGTWTLRCTAPGYESAKAQITVPHRGEWSNATFRLHRLRDRALAAFRRYAIPTLPSEEAWPLRTNREIARASKHQQGPAQALGRINAALEPLYYGENGPSEAQVKELEELARGELADASSVGPPPVPPAGDEGSPR